MDWWNQRHFSNVAPVIVNSLEINVRMFKSSLIFVFYRFALLSFINYCCFGGMSDRQPLRFWVVALCRLPER